MTKEIPPLYRPDNLPPPHPETVVQIKHDGRVKEREVWVYGIEDVKRQQFALNALRKARVASRYSIGGQPGMRLTHNVYPHLRSLRRGTDTAFYLVDLKDAFSNVDHAEVGARLQRLMGRSGIDLTSYERDYLEAYLYSDVGAFLTIDGETIDGVPQGNATSGAMLDVLLNATDYRLGSWFSSGIYTRFIDDLTFSGSADLITGKFPDDYRRTLRTIITETPGVELNNGKTQNLTGDKPITVTGISFNRHGLMAPSRGILANAWKYFNEIEAKLEGHEELTKRDVNVFDGYRGALALAGPPERSSSQQVRTAYNKSIKIGNALYRAAAKEGVIPPRSPLIHAGPKNKRK